jgi:PAS domain S-box-containing protein
MPQATTSMRIFPRQIKLKRKQDISRLFEESVEVFFKVFNFSPGGLIITSRSSGKIVEHNRRYAEMFGLSRKEIIGRSSYELGTIAITELMTVTRIFENTGRLHNLEVRCRHRDGSTIYALVNTVPIELGNKNYTLTSFTDITDLKTQNLLIQEQHKDISDSISYAKRIQDAIFPPEDLIKKLIPDSFVLFKPKAIVSGDFYWIETFNGKTYIAAADCTGHGVPGALMSIVGYNLLSKSINEHGHTKPCDILSELSQGVYITLRQSPGDLTVKDGIDIAVVCIDYEKLTMEYAGAYNPVYMVRNNTLTKIPGDRRPVGIHNGNVAQKFTNREMQMRKNDIIYLLSDGYADQFGGPNKKKFKSMQLQQLLLSVQQKTMSEQKKILDETIEKWKGADEEQIDDILVIGIRL